MKIRKGDTVYVLKGKDKGKTGLVLQVVPDKSVVVVEGVNQYKRHIKSKTAGQKSEIKTITKALNVASVMFVDPTTKKKTKVGYRVVNDKKVRIAKISGQEV